MNVTYVTEVSSFIFIYPYNSCNNARYSSKPLCVKGYFFCLQINLLPSVLPVLFLFKDTKPVH